MANPKFDTICSYGRGGVAEVTVQALWFFAEQGRIRQGSAGIAEELLCMRSLAKPWQFLAIAKHDFASEWVLAVASHSGEVLHEQTLTKLCEDHQIDMSRLRCPAAYPMDDQRSLTVKIQSHRPERRWHPCSGKHAHFVYHAGEDSGYRDYTEPGHDLHHKISAYMTKQGASPRWVMDSCGLPTPIVTGTELAGLWHSLAVSNDPKTRRLWECWTEQPELVGGRDRLDSFIVSQAKGVLVAKEGADGLIAVQSLGGDISADQTVFLKLAHGYQKSHLGLSLFGILQALKPQLNEAFQTLFDSLKNRVEGWHPADQDLMFQSTHYT